MTVASYEYACERCGPFELERPIATAAAQEPCPRCGAVAPRRFTAPALTAPRAPRRRAREAADRSAHEPEVVAAPPPRPRAAPPPANPLHARLPRP